MTKKLILIDTDTHVVVPKVATYEMKNAGKWSSFDRCEGDEELEEFSPDNDECDLIYKTMIEAAPEYDGDPWMPIETAPVGEYVILNISRLNYPVIAVKDKNDEGWMTRTGAFYGVDTADYWSPLLPQPQKGKDDDHT